MGGKGNTFLVVKTIANTGRHRPLWKLAERPLLRTRAAGRRRRRVGRLKLASRRTLSPCQSANATKRGLLPPPQSKRPINAAIRVNARETHVGSKGRNGCIHYTERKITACFTRKVISHLLGMDHAGRRTRSLSAHGACQVHLGFLLLELGSVFRVAPGNPSNCLADENVLAPTQTSRKKREFGK